MDRETQLFARAIQTKEFGCIPPSPPLEAITELQLGQIRNFYEKKATQGVVTIDVDETLVDVRTGQPTDNVIFPLISRMVDTGWVVSLHSLRPASVLRGRTDEFGTNGPNFAEEGEIMDFLMPEHDFIFVNNQHAYGHYQGLQAQVQSELYPYLNYKGYNVDYREFVTPGPENYLRGLQDWEDTEHTHSLWVNKGRMCGLTVFAGKRSTEGKPALIQDEFAKLALDVMKEIEQGMPDGIVSHFVPTHGHPGFIARSESSTKTSTWWRLGKMLGPDFFKGKRAVHFGDRIGDFIDLPGVQTFAPANADQALQELLPPENISAKERTAGVVDILSRMLRGEI